MSSPLRAGGSRPLDNPHDLAVAPSRLPRWVQWGFLAWFVLGVLVTPPRTVQKAFLAASVDALGS